MQYKVSVIVPVYGVEKYIDQSLRAICNQEFDDFEIIVVNDGTKDQSMRIVYEILNEVKIPYKIINKENGGLPSARNAGLNEANGEYVCFIDSDDIVLSTHLKDLYQCCKALSSKVAYAPFELTYESDRDGTAEELCAFRKIEHQELLRGFLCRKYKIHCCALLIDRIYLLERKIRFDERLRYGEDIDFMWRLFPTLDKIGYTSRKSYKYLQRENSLMTNQNIDRVIVLLAVFRETVEVNKKMYPKDSRIFKFLYGKAALAFYRTFAESASLELFKELLKKSNYRSNIWRVVFIGNYKISLLALSLLISPKLFLTIVKKETAMVKSENLL